MPEHVHAFTDDDALGELDAVGLAEEIRARRVSAREAVEAAIARVTRVDRLLHAVAAERYERARHDAPVGGFFSGVPSLIKDNSDLAGLPTQQGTTSYVGRPKRANGDFARMFTALGVVPLGKTRLSEFGFSASAEFEGEPPVSNPWDTGRTSGASSAGAAALVAAGAVPFAHANDGGGSIRIPAACCGLVGLKPSRGRTPSDKLNREMPIRIVADGVVTRSVRDTAAFLRECEKVYRPVSMAPIGDVRGPGKRRLRIALVTDGVGGRQVDADTRRVAEETAALLEGAGHTIEPIAPPVPEYFVRDFLTYWSLLAGFITATGKRTLDRGFDARRTDNLTRGLARYARRHAYAIPLAVARLRASQHRSRRLFDRGYDVVLTPTLGHVTPPLGHLDPTQDFDVILERLLDWVTFTPLQNATGDPGVSVPGGVSSEGLPLGVQLAAGFGREAMLLELAYELEALRPFPRIQVG